MWEGAGMRSPKQEREGSADQEKKQNSNVPLGEAPCKRLPALSPFPPHGDLFSNRLYSWGNKI